MGKRDAKEWSNGRRIQTQHQKLLIDRVTIPGRRIMHVVLPATKHAAFKP
jgi:hypothetical protein